MKNNKDENQWLGVIPSDWKLIKGRYLFKQRCEKGNSIELQLLSPTQKFGVVPQSLYEELSGFSAVKLDEKINLNTLKTVHEGDFCISLRSFQGGFEYSKYEGVCSPAYQIFYPLVLLNVIYYKYLFKDLCFIDKMNSFTLSLRDGKNIAFSDFGNTYLPVPPINKQKQIADYLNKIVPEIDSLHADIEKQIETLEEYKKSIITEAVTKGLDPDVEMKDSGVKWIGKIPKRWTTKKIKNIGEYRNGLTYNPTDMVDKNEGILVLRSSNVQNGKIVYDDNVYVNMSIRPKLKVQKGDILICSRNGSQELIGKNAIIEDEIEASFGAFMMIFRCNCPRYMYYVLNSAVFKYYLGSFFTSTINQLTGNNFGNMKIVFCDDIKERNKIVEFLDKKCNEIDSIIADKKQQLETLEQYKKSLIYEYVTGKKEVPDNE